MTRAGGAAAIKNGLACLPAQGELFRGLVEYVIEGAAFRVLASEYNRGSL